MNHEKEGARYLYPNSFLSMLAAIHAYLLPYRQLEGFVRLFSEHVEALRGKVPDFTTIWHRVSRIKVDLDPDVDLDKDITIAVDSSGIKVSNRGEWIRKVWKVRRGFIKVHIALDIKTKQIVSMQVTREDVSDGKMLKPLVEEASSRADVVGAIGDGSYDSRENFRYLDDSEIEPVIKVRANSVQKAMGCTARKAAVIEQQKDLKRWKKKHHYGMRWMVESAFSALKRTFGEYVTSVRWKSIVNELMLKASIYNLFISMNPK